VSVGMADAQLYSRVDPNERRPAVTIRGAAEN
jgi:hypothetical protein